MEKVKLPKELAEAIETLENAEITTFGIICSLVHERWGHSEHASEAHKVLRKFSFGNSGGNTDVLLKALVNGYEIEMTKEEMALDYYETLGRLMNEAEAIGNRDKALALSNERKGARCILMILGIKIEGINA